MLSRVTDSQCLYTFAELIQGRKQENCRPGAEGGCWGVLDPASPWVPAVLELQIHNYRQDVCFSPPLDAFVGYL